jgi:hypothetical protein
MGPAVSVAPHQPVSRNRTAAPSNPLPRVWAWVGRDDALQRSLALIIAAIGSGGPDARAQPCRAILRAVGGSAGGRHKPTPNAIFFARGVYDGADAAA